MDFFIERLDKKDAPRLKLPEGTVSIGRNPRCTIVLAADDRCASGFHTVIYANPSGLLIQDMQSTNGTFVNGRQVQECAVEAGDEIGLGRSGPKFRIVRETDDPAMEAATPPESTPERYFDIDVGADINVDVDVYDDIDDDINPVPQNRPTANTAPPKRNRTTAIIMAATVLIITGLFLTLILLTRQPVDKREPSPSPKNFFSQTTENPSPPPSPPPSPSTPSSLSPPATSTPTPTTTEERITAILIRFGEDNYRAPPEMAGRVEHYLNLYTGRMRGTIAGYMSRKKQFFPMIHRIFAERNIPLELAYVSMLESGFNTTAKSHAGAVGLWQFMPATARRYGLEVSSRADERTDPEKATCAAAAYFKDLIAIFGARSSVMLCMAAYNAGETRVINALKRIDDPVRNRDFWYLYRMGWLAEETNEYIPQIIALMIISENLEEFGF